MPNTHVMLRGNWFLRSKQNPGRAVITEGSTGASRQRQRERRKSRFGDRLYLLSPPHALLPPSQLWFAQRGASQAGTKQEQIWEIKSSCKSLRCELSFALLSDVGFGFLVACHCIRVWEKRTAWPPAQCWLLCSIVGTRVVFSNVTHLWKVNANFEWTERNALGKDSLFAA